MSQFYLAPESEAMFRRVTHSRLISHVRKDCGCGKQVTAKQIKQYGKCAKCHNVGRARKPAPRTAPSFVAPSTWSKARNV